MKSVITATLVVCVFTVGTLLSWNHSTRRDPRSIWNHERDVNRATAVVKSSPRKIARLVDVYVFESLSPDNEHMARLILSQLGTQAYPRAIEILRDASLTSRLTKFPDRSGAILPKAPFNHLCKLFDLQAAPPQEAASLLAPYLESEHKEIRKNAALIIGSIGSPDALPHLRRALRDQDGYVRSYVLMGIDRAISGDRVGSAARPQFFELVASLWPSDTDFNVCDKIPNVLLRLDRRRGIEFLMSDHLFTLQFNPLSHILDAFDEELVEVARPRLIDLIEQCSSEDRIKSQEPVLRSALGLLGLHRNEEDLPMLERFLEHDSERVSEGATAALYRYHRYKDRVRDPRSVIEAKGWDALTTVERHVCAVEMLDAEVNNGGFDQYYFNSSGNSWQDALAGLAAIGAMQRHQIMKESIEKFGADGPSVHRERRILQLGQLANDSETPFDENDHAWYDQNSERLTRLIYKYNISHLEGREKIEVNEDPASSQR